MAYGSDRRWVVVGLVVLALIVGVFVGFLLDDEEGAPSATPAPEPTEATEPGPTGELNGVPVGYSQTEDGALAAAQAFALVSTTDVIRDQNAYVEAMKTLAAPEWEAEARQQAINGYEFLTERYGSDVDVSGAVIRYKILNYAETEARIKLWLVSIASGSNRPNVDEIWGTAVVDLTWLEGDWRVSRAENFTGPAPVDLPASSPRDSAKALMEELSELEWAP